MIRKFYLQDSRSYMGNDMRFWAQDGGFTTDVTMAQEFTLEQAQAQHDARHSDIPWPKEYILTKLKPVVDIQYVNRSKALADSCIVFHVPPPNRKELTQCHHCHGFMNEAQRYLCGCPKCVEAIPQQQKDPCAV